MTYYLASFIKEELEGVLNGVYNVKLKLQWADGQVGAVPVFATREDAEAYAEGKCEVMEVKVAE